MRRKGYGKGYSFKPKFFSQKTRSKCKQRTQIGSNKKNISMQPPEKLSQRKFILKVAVPGGGKLGRGRHHLSCPDLSRWTEMVDSLDRNTQDMFRDDLDTVGTELNEIYVE